MTRPPNHATATLQGALVAGLRFTGQISRLLLVLYIGRELGATALGLYGLVASTSALLVSLVGLEYHSYAARELLRVPQTERGPIVLRQLRLYLYAWAATLMLLTALHFMDALPAYGLGFVALIAPLAHLSLECQRLLTVLARPIAAYVVNALANGLWVFPLLFAAWQWPLTANLSTVFGAWAVGCGAASLLGATLLVRSGTLRGARSGDASPTWLGLRSGLVFLGSSACLLAIDTLDRYAIEHWLTTHDVGVYTFYATLARSHRDLLFVFAVVPVLPAMIAPSSGPLLRGLGRRITWTSIVLALALSAGLQLALIVLHRPEWSEHPAAFYMLLGGNVLFGWSTGPHYTLYRAGREASLFYAHATGVLIAAVASYLLIPRVGVEGAAAANGIALSAIAGLKYRAAMGLRRSAPVATDSAT
jgi:O-antigen/teichoic acid export membrane protein